MDRCAPTGVVGCESFRLVWVTAPRFATCALLLALSFASTLGGCGGAAAEDVDAGATAPEPELVRDGDRVTVPEGSPVRARLRIEPVDTRIVTRTLTAPARVEVDPSRIARITPPVPGRVVRLAVHFGERVTSGQSLLVLDSPDLALAQAELLDAEATLAQADRDATRQRDLASQGIAARAELEMAETTREIASAGVERSRNRLRLLGVRGSRVGQPLTVRSPIDGRIVELHTSIGEYRSDLAAPMMVVADLSEVWLTADLQERDLGRVAVGMRVTADLAAYPGETPLTGQVAFVGDLLDPESRTLPVRVVFDNAAGRLRPNMFARVTFDQTEHEEVVVPASAILLLGDASYAFVEVAPFVFERRRVAVGDPAGNDLGIREGLVASDRVVAANAILLQ